MATKKKAPGSKAAFLASQKRKGASPALAAARWNFRVMNLGRSGGAVKKRGAKSRKGVHKPKWHTVSLGAVVSGAKRRGIKAFTLNLRGKSRRHAARPRHVAGRRRGFRRNPFESYTSPGMSGGFKDPGAYGVGHSGFAGKGRKGTKGPFIRSSNVVMPSGKTAAQELKEIKKHLAAVKRAEARARKAYVAKKRAARVTGYGWTIAERAAAGKKKKKGARRTRTWAALPASFAGRARKTYAFKTKSGRVEHIPKYAQLGFASAKALEKAKDGPDGDAIREALAQIDKVRAEIAHRVTEGHYEFAPNRGGARRRRRGSAKRSTAMRRRRRSFTSNKGNKARKHKKTRWTPSRLRGKTGKRLSWRQRTKRARRFRRGVTVSLRHIRAQVARFPKFNDNRRRSRRGRRHFTSNRRRHFRRNAGLQAELMTAFKFGALAFGGYAAHRVLTNLLDQQVFAKVEFLNSTGVAPYRKLLAGAVVAAAGVPLAIKALGKTGGNTATLAAAGMALSLVQSLVFAVLGQVDSSGAAAGYLAAYPDDGGYATSLGSYFSFKPHEIYPSNPGAGVGEFLSYGHTGLQQAAAGIGEYQVVPGYNGFGSVDDGVQPNLAAAEQALNIAEAAAGMGEFQLLQAAAGFGDISMVSTSDPAMQSIAIPDEPGGSRAGSLANREGIFG